MNRRFPIIKKLFHIVTIILLFIIIIFIGIVIYIKIKMNMYNFPQLDTDYDTFTRDLDTGDILLYQSYNLKAEFIEWAEPCRYSHISVILKNPTWLNKNLTEEFYIIESIINEDKGAISHNNLNAIKVVPLRYVFDAYNHKTTYRNYNAGHLYIRKLHSNYAQEHIQNKIVDTYNKVKNASYDYNIRDWYNAYNSLYKNDNFLSKFKADHNKQEMFCSAFVTYMYIQIGFINHKIPWTIINPCDYSSTNKMSHLQFENCYLSDDEIRL